MSFWILAALSCVYILVVLIVFAGLRRELTQRDQIENMTTLFVAVCTPVLVVLCLILEPIVFILKLIMRGVILLSEQLFGVYKRAFSL